MILVTVVCTACGQRYVVKQNHADFAEGRSWCHPPAPLELLYKTS